MTAVWIVLVVYAGAVVGVILRHRDHREDGVWWQGQRIGPYCVLALTGFIPLTVLIRRWPSMPWPVVLSPVLITIGLIIAASIGLYRSEREERGRNRALGEPTHRYLKSTNRIIAGAGIFIGLVLIFIAGAISDRSEPTPTTNTIEMVLVYMALAVVVGTFVFHTYCRARRHHEIVVMAHQRLATYPPRGPAPKAGCATR